MTKTYEDYGYLGSRLKELRREQRRDHLPAQVPLHAPSPEPPLGWKPPEPEEKPEAPRVIIIDL